MRIYYYGCNKEAGHYLFRPPMTRVRVQVSELPWQHIDMDLCSQATRREGIAKLHHKDGWTAMAFWDNSVDSRPGSNSVFFYEDLFYFNEMIREFKEHFPKIFDRFKFRITEYRHPHDE